MPIDALIYQQMMQVFFNPVVVIVLLTMLVGAFMLISFPRMNLVISMALMTFLGMTIFAALKMSAISVYTKTATTILAIGVLFIMAVIIGRIVLGHNFGG